MLSQRMRFSLGCLENTRSTGAILVMYPLGLTVTKQVKLLVDICRSIKVYSYLPSDAISLAGLLIMRY